MSDALEKTNHGLLTTLSRLLKYILLASAAYYVVVYLVIVCSRIAYPYELEWMEGGSVDHVRRILAGQPLYIRPSLSFTPFIYTPLYFYVSAAVAKCIGIGFTPLAATYAA